MKILPSPWFFVWYCSADIDRLLAGRTRRELCGELRCIECGPTALVIVVGAAISVMRPPPYVDHDGFVVTLHGVDRDASPEEVGAVVPLMQRFFDGLHEHYYALDFWWTVEQELERRRERPRLEHRQHPQGARDQTCVRGGTRHGPQDRRDA